MADLLSIGSGALIAYQTALTTTGHNISNADVEGYTRQTVTLGAQAPSDVGAGFVGNGVGVLDIARVIDAAVTQQIRFDSANFNEIDVFVTQIDQLDRILAEGATGLSVGFESFFSASNRVRMIPLQFRCARCY